MPELSRRLDPASPPTQPQPPDADAARSMLEAGNREFLAAFSESEPGSVPTIPEQRPFASVLGCSDARGPIEIVLGQRANALFVTRVAGQVLGPVALGSVEYAVRNIESIRLQVVLGHSDCGAAAAAVDAYLEPTRFAGLAQSRALLSVVNHVLGAVRMAAVALSHVHGPEVVENPAYRRALVETTVTANTAVSANVLSHHLRDSDVAVVMGVYDLASRLVGLPGASASWVPGLTPAPATENELSTLLQEVAFGPYITGVLGTQR